MKQKFKYDVALSFLSRDEELAIQIDQLLRDRYSTFIYSQRQDELVGRDGGEKFAAVFGEECRIALVLFRNEWGKRGGTMVEMTAIRNRAHTETFEFTLFVALDKEPRMPKWLPRLHLWLDYPRFGIKGILVIVESLIRQAGGVDRPETIEDRAKRLKDQIALQAKREGFFNSNEKFGAAREAFNLTRSALELIASKVDDPEGGLQTIKETGQDAVTIKVHWSKMHAQLENIPDADGLHFPNLFVKFYKIDRSLFAMPHRFKECESLRYRFDMSLSDEKGWREADNERTFSTPQALAEKLFRALLDMVSVDVANRTQYPS